MNTQEFVLIPKSFYTQHNTSTSQVLKDPQLEERAKSLTLLQRHQTFSDAPEQEETVSVEKILSSIDMLNRSQKDSSREILKKIENSDVIGFNSEGKITINKTATQVPVSIFLYDLQQPRKTISDSTYRIILEQLKPDQSLVSNVAAKNFLQSNDPTPKKSRTKKRKQAEKTSPYASDQESEGVDQIKASSSKKWTTIG